MLRQQGRQRGLIGAAGHRQALIKRNGKQSAATAAGQQLGKGQRIDNRDRMVHNNPQAVVPHEKIRTVATAIMPHFYDFGESGAKCANINPAISPIFASVVPELSGEA
ncbi:MAG TPA: hypothetical protein VKY74_08365 [Chloroflexia bacterium]|nr:hypothetical protein [Chloroflexia bacterium]